MVSARPALCRKCLRIQYLGFFRDGLKIRVSLVQDGAVSGVVPLAFDSHRLDQFSGGRSLANGLQSLLAAQFARLHEPGGIRDELFWA